MKSKHGCSDRSSTILSIYFERIQNKCNDKWIQNKCNDKWIMGKEKMINWITSPNLATEQVVNRRDSYACTVQPCISPPRLSGNLAIRTDYGGNEFFPLYLYSHIRKFALRIRASILGTKWPIPLQTCLANPGLPKWLHLWCLCFHSAKSLSITCTILYLYKCATYMMSYCQCCDMFAIWGGTYNFISESQSTLRLENSFLTNDLRYI